METSRKDFMQIRVNRQEREAIKAAASSYGMTVSEWIRAMATKRMNDITDKVA